MEWVEVTGKTVAEAKDKALDRLGVDEREAEFEVVDEPVTGLFGRLKREARVRARVRPNVPRVAERSRRRNRRDRPNRNEGAGGGEPAERDRANDRDKRERRDKPARAARTEASAGAAPARRERAERPKPTTEEPTVSLETQADIATAFMRGLTDAFGLSSTVSWSVTNDDHAEVNVDGAELGLLIGPKGRTLAAINEISRAVVLRQLDSAPEGRVHIDVAGYRQRRREALERFARSVATQVAESGVRRVLEPMNAPDRKIVHDAVADIAGVRTSSEGEDPSRRVVISPVD